MKKIVSLILALALLLALTACGSGTSAGTAETTAPASTVDDSKGTQIDADGSQVPDVARLAGSEKISCASLWIAASLNIYRMETAV